MPTIVDIIGFIRGINFMLSMKKCYQYNLEVCSARNILLEEIASLTYAQNLVSVCYMGESVQD